MLRILSLVGLLLSPAVFAGDGTLDGELASVAAQLDATNSSEERMALYVVKSVLESLSDAGVAEPEVIQLYLAAARSDDPDTRGLALNAARAGGAIGDDGQLVVRERERIEAEVLDEVLEPLEVADFELQSGGWLADAQAEVPEGSAEWWALYEYGNRQLSVERVTIQTFDYNPLTGNLDFHEPIETFKVTRGGVKITARQFSKLVDSPPPRGLRRSIPANYDEVMVGQWVEAYNDVLMQTLDIDVNHLGR